MKSPFAQMQKGFPLFYILLLYIVSLIKYNPSYTNKDDFMVCHLYNEHIMKKYTD